MSEASAATTQTAAQPGVETPVLPATQVQTTKPAAQPSETPIRSIVDKTTRDVLKKSGLKVSKDTPLDQVARETKEKLDSQKERRRTAEKDLATTKAQLADATTSLGALKQFADLEMAALDPKQQTIIKTLAGDDPSEQLRQIAALKSLADANKPAPVASPKTAPVPANTAPDAAPAPAGTMSDLPLTEQWTQLRSIQDPTQRETLKALFALQHGGELLTAQAAQRR